MDKLLGDLYVFEGPDGTGKTTLSKAFLNYLKSKGEKCSYFSFPGNCSGTLGNHIYQLHHGLSDLKIASINATSLQLLHVASHIDTIESRILPVLRDGHSVILDRFWWSTIAYGTVYGAEIDSLKKLVGIERIHWRGIQPTFVFYLKRNTSLKATGDNYWNRLVDGYEKIVKHELGRYGIQSITNQSSVDDALSQVIEIFRHHKRKP